MDIYFLLAAVNGIVFVGSLASNVVQYKLVTKDAGKILNTKNFSIARHNINYGQIKKQYNEANKEFQVYIEEYEKVLNSKPHINKQFYNKNISETTIYIYNIIDRIKAHNGAGLTVGYYDLSDKVIKLRKKIIRDKEVFFHELTHLANACKKDGIGYCGFSQYDKSTKKSIGDGLNEGFTELFVRKNFNLQGKTYNCVYNSVEALTEIIGMEKMETLFFDCNLGGLVDEIKKYGVYEEEINRFILNLDYIVYERNSTLITSKQYKNCQKEVYMFITKLFAKKKTFESENQVIDDEMIKFETKKFSLQYYNNKKFIKKKMNFVSQKESDKIDKYVDEALEEVFKRI